MPAGVNPAMFNARCPERRCPVAQMAPEPEPPPNVPPRKRHVVTTYSFADYQASSPYAWSGWRRPPGGVTRKDG
jgi:hypothetical protein